MDTLCTNKVAAPMPKNYNLLLKQLVSKVLEVSFFDLALLLVQYFLIGLLRKDSFLPLSLVTFAVCGTFVIYPRQPGQPTQHGL